MKDCLISQDTTSTPQKNWLISQKSGYHTRMPHFNEASGPLQKNQITSQSQTLTAIHNLLNLTKESLAAIK